MKTAEWRRWERNRGLLNHSHLTALVLDIRDWQRDATEFSLSSSRRPLLAATIHLRWRRLRAETQSLLEEFEGCVGPGWLFRETPLATLESQGCTWVEALTVQLWRARNDTAKRLAAVVSGMRDVDVRCQELEECWDVRSGSQRHELLRRLADALRELSACISRMTSGINTL